MTRQLPFVNPLTGLALVVWVCAACGPETVTLPALQDLPADQIPPSVSPAYPDSVVLDGRFGDWLNIPTALNDAAGDSGEATGIDITRVQTAHDDDYLYISFDVGVDLLLNDGQYLKLFIDADRDPDTGEPINDQMGAELEWTFGQRSGFFYSGTRAFPIQGQDIGIQSAPTVTSQRFEIALSRSATPGGGDQPWLRQPAVNVMLRDNTFNAQGQVDGDSAPENGEVLSHTFSDADSLPSPTPIALDKDDPDALRIVSWNVLRDGLYEQSRIERFRRVLQALNPDVINFQELYEPERAPALLAEWFPDVDWAVESYGDRTTFSRLPIVEGWPQNYGPLHRRYTVVPIQASEDRRLLIFNAHLSFGDNNAQRQDQADSFAAYVRDLMTPGGDVDAPEGTPMVLLGDLNLVGYHQQLETLLTGQIRNVVTYGSPGSIDWDGSPMRDLRPRQIAQPMTFTWRSPTSSYWPGRLDFFIYTDSVLSISKSFVLDTEQLDDETRARLDLKRRDTTLASDHLPIVVDVRIKE